MIEPTKFALFTAVSWALIIAPGPDMFYVITRAMTHGRRAGIVSAVGVVSGILVHTTAAALGLTVLFQSSALAFLVVKYLGAAYLIYLGFKGWRNKDTFSLQAPAANTSLSALFGQGLMSNVLNPKIGIFFLAFLPQFVNQGSSQVTLQMASLGLTFAFFGLCFLVTVGYFAGTVGAWLTQRPQYTNTLRWLNGGILIGLGVRLALTEQR